MLKLFKDPQIDDIQALSKPEGTVDRSTYSASLGQHIFPTFVNAL